MSKRAAASDLNRDNWQEDDAGSHELGVFKQASEETMRGRLIKKAKRRGETIQEPLTPVFSNFTAFGTETVSSPKFSFGLKTKSSQIPSLGLKAKNPFVSSFEYTNKHEEKTVIPEPIKSLSDVDKIKPNEDKMDQLESEKPKFQFTFTGSQNIKVNKSDKPNDSCESTIKTSPVESKSTDESSTNKLYFGNLKALNLGVLKWIRQHVEKNPYVSLIPVFDDYKKYLNDLKKKHNDEHNDEQNRLSESGVISDMNKIGTSISLKNNTNNPLNIQKPNVTTSTFSFDASSSQSSGSNFSFGIKSQPSFSFGFSGSEKTEAKLDIVGDVVSGSTQEKTTVDKDGEPSDELPTVQINDVKEEGSIYDKKVKLFYQNDGSYIEKGVGTLFLKPVGEKTQLIVRALNSLGNILLNIVLNNSIPTRRLGKNNVLIVCIPNPPMEPKNTPISMLIRVKTSQEADDLLEKIEENKK